MRFHHKKMLGKSTFGQEMGSTNLALPPGLFGVAEVSKALSHQSPSSRPSGEGKEHGTLWALLGQSGSHPILQD
jgi:hypothetical protein